LQKRRRRGGGGEGSKQQDNGKTKQKVERRKEEVEGKRMEDAKEDEGGRGEGGMKEMRRMLWMIKMRVKNPRDEKDERVIVSR
jgi:hypothetical protein